MAAEIAYPATTADLLRERVRKVLLDAVPDEALDTMLKAEWKAFFDPIRQYGGGPLGRPSPFQQLVAAEIRSQLEAVVKQAIASEIQQQYSPERGRNEIVGDIVKKMAPSILESVAEEFARKALQALRTGSY